MGRILREGQVRRDSTMGFASLGHYAEERWEWAGAPPSAAPGS